MTTTAHEDQFTDAPEPVRQPYDTVAILRRNIADMEKELQRQSTMANHWRQQYAIIYDEMQGTPCAEIRWQHERKELTERAEKAEAELAKLAQQKPIKYLYRVTDCFGNDVLRDDPKGATILETIPLFAVPVPTPHKGATHCDDCGLTWLDDGLNPLGCPYCKDSAPAPAVPAAHDMVITNIVNVNIWVQGGKVYARCANTSEGTGVFVFDGKNFGVTADTWVLMINLLQSAEVRHD